jgi:hypothetical protein
MRASNSCKKRHSLFEFSYVCPEPVLVKRSFCISMAPKKAFSHRDQLVGRPGAVLPPVSSVHTLVHTAQQKTPTPPLFQLACCLSRACLDNVWSS